MADPWIKMRVTLPSCPQVVRLASAFDADKCPLSVRCHAAVGALHATWSLADAHTEDGTLTGYTLEALDLQIGIEGWGQALVDVGWLVVSPDGITFPRFNEHNGSTRKRRDMEAERKRGVRKTSASDADKSPDEKRTLSSSLSKSSSSSNSKKKGGAAETWEQVLARPEYEALRADPEFTAAWSDWIEWTETPGSKAKTPRGRQAAVLLNKAVKAGAPAFARAVENAIGGDWAAPNPDYASSHAKPGTQQRTGGGQLRDEQRSREFEEPKPADKDGFVNGIRVLRPGA